MSREVKAPRSDGYRRERTQPQAQARDRARDERTHFGACLGRPSGTPFKVEVDVFSPEKRDLIGVRVHRQERAPQEDGDAIAHIRHRATLVIALEHAKTDAPAE